MCIRDSLADRSKVACFMALAEGFHPFPLADSRFHEAGFVIAFIPVSYTHLVTKNEAKYPVEKARGRAEKYTEL